MEEEKKLSLDDFMDLFVTVSYLQEQRYFNLDVLKSFMKVAFKLSDEEAILINDELDRIVGEMQEKGYVEMVKNFEYLVRINNSIPFMEIVTKNFEYLNKMIKFLYHYVSYDYQVDRNVCNYNEKDAIQIEKTYKKERNVK